ncbi:MAG: helix-turn-helix transcriptional regulator [Firmicutes bacterium]|nr:helix-turn-helix transcriptional regulator [Bacillota bacterium]
MVDRQYLEKLMKINGIENYKELAKKCHLKYTTILYIYKGNNPGIETFIKIADYFHISVDSLLCRSKKETLVVISEECIRKITLRSTENLKSVITYLLIK